MNTQISGASSVSQHSKMAKPVSVYVGLVYGLTWTCWVPAVILSKGSHAPLWSILWLLGVFMPGLIALVMTALQEGEAGISALALRLIQFRASVGWYVFALTFMVAIKLAAALLVRLVSGSWPPFGREGTLIMLIATILSTPAQAGEEVGWRGYLLLHVAQKLGYARASIVVGIIWAVWHLPQFFLTGADTFGQSFPIWCIGITALSIAITWLYVHTRASMFFAMLMHAAINNTKDIVPSQNPGQTNPFSLHASAVMYATTFWLCACAAWFLSRMPAGMAISLPGDS